VRGGNRFIKTIELVLNSVELLDARSILCRVVGVPQAILKEFFQSLELCAVAT
jgi:hypothetical protein